MQLDKCCKDQPPIIEAIFEKGQFFDGKTPTTICDFHWNIEDENGRKYWRSGIIPESIRFLKMEAIPQ